MTKRTLLLTTAIALLVAQAPSPSVAEIERVDVIGEFIGDNATGSLTSAQANEFIQRNSGAGIIDTQTTTSSVSKEQLTLWTKNSLELAQKEADTKPKYREFWKKFVKVVTYLEGLDIAATLRVEWNYEYTDGNGTTTSGKLGWKGSTQIRVDDAANPDISEKPMFLPRDGSQLFPEGQNEDVCTDEAWEEGSGVQCAYYTILPTSDGGVWLSIVLVDKLTVDGRGISSADSSRYNFYAETPDDLLEIIRSIL